MTDTGAGLLWAVLCNPAEDACRLVYADWLEDEGGQPERAEFIRVQIALTTAPEWCPCGAGKLVDRGAFGIACRLPRCALLAREHESLHADACRLSAEWFACPGYELQAVCGGPTVWMIRNVNGEPVGQVELCPRRGFVEEISLPCAAFLEHAEALFRAQPITRVRLVDVRPWNAGNHRFGWTADSTDGGEVAWFIPDDLFKHLPPSDLERRFSTMARRWYSTETMAHAALSAACVALGRERAGLPPLP